jgi:hypothetical protein
MSESVRWSRDQVLGVAPDAASVNAAVRLARGSAWRIDQRRTGTSAITDSASAC